MKITKYIFLLINIIIILNFIIDDSLNNKIEDVNIDISKEVDLEINTSKVIYKDGFYYENISDELKEKITGCSFPNSFDNNYTSISYSDLRYVKIKHYDLNNNINDGELIVHKEVAQDIVEIFYELFLNKYPIEKISLVENYNCIDELSMQDNNTSSFNYRTLENSDELSWHAFGLAIDINPLYNPYIYEGKVYPSNAKEYVDRTLNINLFIDYDDLCYKLFKKYGWSWGGDFSYTKDYQHFYKENVLEDSIRKRKH